MNKGHEAPAAGNSRQTIPRRSRAGVTLSLNNKPGSKNSSFVDLT